MRLTSFVAQGRETYGLVVGQDALVDLGARVGERWSNLRRLIGSGELEAVGGEHGTAPADYRFDEVRFLPAIPRPTHILSSGGNFPAHIQEMVDAGMSKGAPPQPGFHVKTSGSLVGHLNPLVRPKASGQFDWENEFALVIGQGGRHIPRDRALDHVMGYSMLHDGSIRDVQLQQSVTAGKNFEASSSLGPWISTPDEVGDPNEIYLTTRLNGQVVQHEQVGSLVFPLDLLVSYVSGFINLQPGDVITTGTCGGVGFFRKPQLFMKAGDVVEFEADRIGVMRHEVIDEV